MNRNPLVDYLRTYGPLAASDSIYDEHVVRSAKANGVETIEIPSPLLGKLVGNFAGPDPVSVILTGTAGDGKTWHCRKTYVALGGDPVRWDAADGMLELPLPSGKTLLVVKDLSQFHEDPRQEQIFEGLVRSVASGEGDTVYLLAANDGQLLRFLRKHLGADAEVTKLEESVRHMLEGDETRWQGLNLEMHNLSRQSHGELFEQIVDAVTGHPGWERCEGCSLLEGGACAIRRNREVLSVRADASMRRRLGDLIRISAANDTHLPVRHILVLIVNVLLGVSGRKNTMMTCAISHAMAAESSQAGSNPYDSAAGLNLKANENREYLAFNVFQNAGIGLETNNEIDALLIDKQPAALHRDYVTSDPVHGERLFENLRSNYRKGAYDDFGPLQAALEGQRRRLFFVLPETAGESEIDPWRLTVFRHGGQYLAFCRDLSEGKQSKHIKSRLVTGLNRSYSGVMCEDSNVLWLTGPAANTQSRVGRILDCELPVGSDAQGAVCFDFGMERGGRPKMSVKARAGFRDPFQEVACHSLSPLLFEYLMRVERGSLPGSFSRQCFEELRQFRLRIMAQLHKMGLAEREDLNGMKIVRLGEDGRLVADALDVVAAE